MKQGCKNMCRNYQYRPHHYSFAPPPHDGDGLKDKCTLWLLYLVTWFPFGDTVLGSSRPFKECSLDGGTMSLRDGLSDFVAFPQLLFTLCFLLWNRRPKQTIFLNLPFAVVFIYCYRKVTDTNHNKIPSIGQLML